MRDWIRLLIKMVTELKLAESRRVRQAVANIAVTNNQKMAEKWVKWLSRLYYEQQLLPNQFLSTECELQGRFLIGHRDDGSPLGLDEQDLARHVLITGQSGSGKTNLMRLLFKQAAKARIHTWFLDRKRDMLHTAKQGTLCIPWQRFRFNPLRPPRGASVVEWRNDFARVYTEIFQFMSRGHAIFLQGLDELYRQYRVYEEWPRWDDTKPFPTMRELLDHFQNPVFAKRVKNRGRESLASIVDKHQALLVELGQVMACRRGFDLERLYRDGEAVVLAIDGLSADYQGFLVILLILHHFHYFKAHGPRDRLRVLLFFEEAKSFFGKRFENSFLVDLISQVRGYNLGLIAADQIPYHLSQSIFSNTGHLVMFRHSDGYDLQRLRYSSGATFQQSLENYSLKTGECIIRTRKAKDLQRIKVPHQDGEYIGQEEWEELVQPRLARLLKNVIPAKHEVSTARQARQKVKTGLAEDEKMYLEFLARGGMELASSKVSKELGLTQSKGYRIKQNLLKQGLISQVRTNLGKGGRQVKMLIPSRLALDALGIEIPPGKGEILHKHFQKRAKEKAEHQGWKAQIEFGEGREAVDVAIEKNYLRVAVEFSITSKPQTEAENIKKAINLGFDLVVLCFVHTRVKNRAEEIAKATYPAKILERVRVVLAHEFDSVIRELEEWKQS